METKMKGRTKTLILSNRWVCKVGDAHHLAYHHMAYVVGLLPIPSLILNVEHPDKWPSNDT